MSDWIQFEIRLLRDDDYIIEHNEDTLKGFLYAFFGWFDELKVIKIDDRTFHSGVSELSLCDLYEDLIACQERAYGDFEIFIKYGRYEGTEYKDVSLGDIKV